MTVSCCPLLTISFIYTRRTLGSRRWNSQNRDVSASLRDVLQPFLNHSVTFLNTSGNLLGTSGSKKLRHPNFKSFKVSTPNVVFGTASESSANQRQRFGTFGNPSSLTRHLLKAFCKASWSF